MVSSFHRWRLAVLCGLGVLVSSGLVSYSATAAPSAAARGGQRFFEGTFSADGDQRVQWIGFDGSKVYGIATPNDLDIVYRYVGKRRGSHLSGRVFDNADQQIGTFAGTFSAAENAVSGTVQLNSGVTGTWQAAGVVRDKTTMRSVKGKYRDVELAQENVDFIVKLSPSGSVSGKGTAQRVQVGTIRGKWMVDTNGGLWWMPLSVKLERFVEPPSSPLFQPKSVFRLLYQIRGDRVDILDPFDPSDVLTTLERKRK